MIKQEIQQDILDLTDILLGLDCKVEIYFNRTAIKNNIHVECNLICIIHNHNGLVQLKTLMDSNSDIVQSIKYTPNNTNYPLKSDTMVLTTGELHQKLMIGEAPLQLVISMDDFENAEQN